ncbi:DUF3307 domain-containing protein [Rhodohalobacter sp. SW132]|uniref:DUF3307 domain-containing protein n=1 Tax=Rhodohalobacter sp. SW132 TaxID=2293433 RepID=UPI000E274EFD|nr:DUF3307 domain-containing protein [Rhodohalobacter sp. SW132]REL33287.1 DUF3307 domain-containing protein [Rhodohalobacter sp. SW132]
MILVKLLLAHLVGDFILQPKSWIKDKNERKWRSPWLWVHSLIHFLLIMGVLWNWSVWSVALFIAGTHLVIDGIKLTFQREETQLRWFTIDQLAHLTILLLVWSFYWEFSMVDVPVNTIWVVLTGVLFVTYPAAIIIQRFMQGWSQQFESNDDGTLRGAGTYIGILERLFIIIAMLTSNLSVIGFLLAAKSVFRFGDLSRSEDRKLTEYILIGTLLSFFIAILTGLAMIWGLRLIQ